MRLNASLGALTLVFVWHTAAYGQAAPPRAVNTQAPATPIVGVQQTTAPKDLTEVAAQLSALRSAIDKLTEKAAKTDYTPAGLGLLGVVIGAVITSLTQRYLAERAAQSNKVLADAKAAQERELANAKATQERELAENRARLEIGNSFVQWQLKQLSELYGPLHALLRQSNALYRHMNTVVAKANPARFRLRQSSPGDDFDGKLFEINLNGHWSRFRTIMHIGEVYGQNYRIEGYFDGLVEIGGEMVKIIREKAGYVRPDQLDLASVFGEYLAHYSVLDRLHSSMKAKHQASTKGSDAIKEAQDASAVDESAVFPQAIQGLVDTGYKAIIDDLDKWRAKAAA